MALKSVEADNFGIHGNESFLSNSSNSNKNQHHRVGYRVEYRVGGTVCSDCILDLKIFKGKGEKSGKKNMV